MSRMSPGGVSVAGKQRRVHIGWLLVACISLLAFFIDWIAVESGKLGRQDTATGRAIRMSVGQHGRLLAGVLSLTTRIDNHPLIPVVAVAGVLTAVLLARRLTRTWCMVVVVLAGGTLLGFTARRVIVRPPPQSYGPHSFPSGHSLVATVVVGIVVYVTWRLTAGGSVWALLLGVLAFALAGLVGLERLVAHGHGVHYVTDVLGGYALGLAWLAAVLAVSVPLLESRLPRGTLPASDGRTSSR